MGKWERWQKNKPCDLNPQALHKYKANVQQSVDILLEHVTLCVYVFKASEGHGRTTDTRIRTHPIPWTMQPQLHHLHHPQHQPIFNEKAALCGERVYFLLEQGCSVGGNMPSFLCIHVGGS